MIRLIDSFTRFSDIRFYGGSCTIGPSRISVEHYNYNNFWDKSPFPNLWKSENIRDGFHYHCAGTDTYSRRNMSILLTDATELKAHVDLLIEEPPYYPV